MFLSARPPLFLFFPLSSDVKSVRSEQSLPGQAIAHRQEIL